MFLHVKCKTQIQFSETVRRVLLEIGLCVPYGVRVSPVIRAHDWISRSTGLCYSIQSMKPSFSGCL